MSASSEQPKSGECDCTSPDWSFDLLAHTLGRLCRTCRGREGRTFPATPAKPEEFTIWSNAPVGWGQ